MRADRVDSGKRKVRQLATPGMRHLIDLARAVPQREKEFSGRISRALRRRGKRNRMRTSLTVEWRYRQVTLPIKQKQLHLFRRLFRLLFHWP